MSTTDLLPLSASIIFIRMPTQYTTTLFPSVEAWKAAGRPIGGVMPVEHPYPHPQAIPARYRNLHPVYYVALPGNQLWCPWHRAYNKDKGYSGEGWNVSGPPETMTVTPSIKTDRYHGHLVNGVLSATNDSEL